MGTTADMDADRREVLLALAEGRKVDPEVAKRVRAWSEQLRDRPDRQFDTELSVELIRSVRSE
jgi:hypothetical protein